MSPDRAALVERYLRQRDGDRDRAPSPTIPRRPPGAPIPLSYPQQHVWLHSRLADAPVYNEALTIHRRGPLDVGALEASLTEIVRRHEAWRTIFVDQAGLAVQHVLPPAPVALRVVDLSDLPPAAREAEAVGIATEQAVAPHDLRRRPPVRFTLLRLADDHHQLCVALHHIVFDGVSVYRVFLPELIALYTARVEGRPSPLPEPTIQYGDYAAWQRQQVDAGAYETQLAYWRRRLSDAVVADLPLDHARPAIHTARGRQHRIQIPPVLTAALRRLAEQERVSVYMTLLAAFAVLLQRYSGQDDVVVGTVTAGRKPPEVERLLGYFLNPLALRTDLGGDPTVRELLSRVRDTTLGALVHDEVPFEVVSQTVQPRREPGRTPLFQAVLSLEPPLPPIEPGWDLTQMEIDTGATKFDLYLELDERADTILGRFMYRQDLFEPATIARMAAHYHGLLEALAVDPGRRLAELSLVTAAERQQLLAWRGAPTNPPPERTVHERFAAVAARTPDAIALLSRDEMMTYGDLDARANALAHRLVARGVPPGGVAGVLLDRSPRLVVALLAILKAGGAYLPLDPSYPSERLRFMLEDAGAAALVTDESAGDAVPHEPWPTIVLDATTAPPAAPAAPAPIVSRGPDDLAYVMYTSGSTGRPKGVAVPHRAILRLLFGQTYATLGPGETLLQLAPVSFDASTFELWGALLHGARCVLVPARVPTYDALGAVVARHGVTTLWLTASLFNAIVDEAPEAVRGVRRIITGGEALSVPHVRRAFERLPGVTILNGYGPTEATTFTCCHEIPGPPPAAATSIPIGRPLAGTEVYVLDRWRNLVPAGVPGELYIGGAGLARGYVNRPELTLEAFVPSPLDPGARLYRSGDRVRWRPDGTLEFLGRLDAQVKIRGFRVEPGEVEAALASHPDIREAAVVASESPRLGRVLVAYVVARPGAVADPAALRAHLRDRLPPHMVPDDVAVLDALPLTPNGKLDRDRLPPPGPPARPVGVPPRDALEAQLVELWQGLLGVPSLGVTDDFFEAGGHSLLAVRLIQQVDDLYGVRLPLTTLHAGPTVERLAQAVRRGDGREASAPVARIHGAGPRPPLFFFHGDLDGGGFYCLRLARGLGVEQPFYIVHPLGHDGGAVPSSIEAMAERHLVSLRDVAPSGPWRLGGYCNGGLVAYEIARRLVAAGEPVELLVLVAAAPDLRLAGLSQVVERGGALLGAAPESRRDLFARVRSLAWHLTAVPPRQRPALLGHHAAKLVRGAAAGRGGHAAADSTYDHYFRAVMGYVPGRFPGHVVLFWPEAERRPAGDPTCGWGRLAARVDVHGVPGDHSSAVSRHADLIAERLRPYLAGAHAR